MGLDNFKIEEEVAKKPSEQKDFQNNTPEKTETPNKKPDTVGVSPKSPEKKGMEPLSYDMGKDVIDLFSSEKSEDEVKDILTKRYGADAIKNFFLKDVPVSASIGKNTDQGIIIPMNINNKEGVKIAAEFLSVLENVTTKNILAGKMKEHAGKIGDGEFNILVNDSIGDAQELIKFYSEHLEVKQKLLKDIAEIVDMGISAEDLAMIQNMELGKSLTADEITMFQKIQKALPATQDHVVERDLLDHFITSGKLTNRPDGKNKEEAESILTFLSACYISVDSRVYLKDLLASKSGEWGKLSDKLQASL